MKYKTQSREVVEGFRMDGGCIAEHVSLPFFKEHVRAIMQKTDFELSSGSRTKNFRLRH